MDAAVVLTLSEGKIAYIEFYVNRSEALKAAGLERQPLSANVDLVRSIYADWGRGDFFRSAWAHPEIEFEFADGPEPGRWVGIEEMAERYINWLRGWRDFRARPERYLVLDERRILVLVFNTARGRTSGVELEQRSVANYFEIHEAKVTRLVLYWDRDRAFADLGLTPESA